MKCPNQSQDIVQTFIEVTKFIATLIVVPSESAYLLTKSVTKEMIVMMEVTRVQKNVPRISEVWLVSHLNSNVLTDLASTKQNSVME